MYVLKFLRDENTNGLGETLLALPSRHGCGSLVVGIITIKFEKMYKKPLSSLQIF